MHAEATRHARRTLEWMACTYLFESLHRHHLACLLVQTLPDLPVGACATKMQLEPGLYGSSACVT